MKKLGIALLSAVSFLVNAESLEVDVKLYFNNEDGFIKLTSSKGDVFFYNFKFFIRIGEISASWSY